MLSERDRGSRANGKDRGGENESEAAGERTVRCGSRQYGNGAHDLLSVAILERDKRDAVAPASTGSKVLQIVRRKRQCRRIHERRSPEVHLHI